MTEGSGMAMLERLERVAMARCEEIGIADAGAIVRAILTEMREPSEEMLKAAQPHFSEVSDMIVFCHARGSHRGGLSKDPLPPAFTAMIDAILEGRKA